MDFINGPIARETLRTSVVLGLRLVLLTGTLLLLARLLGPEQFGAFAGIAALAILLGTLSTCGTHLVLLAESSQSFEARWEVLRYCIPTTLTTGTALILVYLLVALSLLPGDYLSTSELTAVGVTELLLQPFITIPAVQYQAKDKSAISQLLTTIPLAIRFLIVVVLAIVQVDDPLPIYIYSCVAASIVGIVVGTIALGNPWPSVRAWRLPLRGELKRSVGYAILNLTAAGPGELDKVLAVRLLPLSSAGVYAATARVIGALTLPIFAMVYTILPTLFRSANRDLRSGRKLLFAFFGSAVAYGVGLVGGLWLVAPHVAWFFGEKYSGLESAIQLFCLAIPAISLRLTCGAFLMANGRPWTRVILEVSGLVSLSALSFLLSPKFGIRGMITAVIISETIMALLGSWMAITLYVRGKNERYCRQ